MACFSTRGSGPFFARGSLSLRLVRKLDKTNKTVVFKSVFENLFFDEHMKTIFEIFFLKLCPVRLICLFTRH